MPGVRNLKTLVLKGFRRNLLASEAKKQSRFGTTLAPLRDHYTVLVDEAVQAGSGDVEDACRVPLVSARSLKHSLDLGPFGVR